MKSWDDIMIALNKPFNWSDIKWRLASVDDDKKNGMAVAYVSNRAIQNRLDEAVGCGFWKNEFKEWHEPTQALPSDLILKLLEIGQLKDYQVKGMISDYAERSQICGISIYNSDLKEWITKWDGADETNIEGTKGGLSDSMKRAAGQWGIGRYLYDLPNFKVPVKQIGRTSVIEKYPNLPEWAYDGGILNKQMIASIESKATLKGAEIGKILSFYMKTEIEQLTIDEYKDVMAKLDQKKDI